MRYFIKSIIFYFFTLTLLVSVSSNLAQSQEGNKKQEEGLYSQLVQGVIRLEEHQSICTPGRELAIERDVPVGSAFFIRDRLTGKDTGEVNRLFLVTARHVVENHADLFARIKAGPHSSNIVVLRLPRQLWVFHPAPTQKGKFPIDVAVMMIPPTDFIKIFLHCTSADNPGGCGIREKTKEPLENQLDEPPTVMDPALLLGFPSQHVAKQAFEPFARAGIVAYTAVNPDLNVNGLPLADDSVFLIDALAFPGNSGGPVMREPRALSGGIRLWGLVTGSEPYQARYTVATSVKRIHETLVYARPIAKLNSDAWGRQLPSLQVKCVP
jgi:hypothetical protein